MLAVRRAAERALADNRRITPFSKKNVRSTQQRPLSFHILSTVIQNTIRNALGEKTAHLKPHVGWLNGGVKSRQDFLAQKTNRSQEFQALVEKLKEGSGLDEWPSCANNHVFVFVGGLWSHFYPDSYIGALSGLLGRGIKTTRITAHDTRCSTEVNGAIIASELKKIVQKWPQKKIIIMAHSKGSLDTLEALRVDPSIAPHVQHLIAFQSPFGGSPYANAYLESDTLAKSVIDSLVIRWLAGDYSGVKSLTYESRKEWFKNNPVDKLGVPVLCCVTNAMPTGLIFEDLASYVRSSFGDIDNDGLVVSQDAVLPNSDFVYIEGVSHLASVINDSLNCELLPSVALEALTYMALRPKKAKEEAVEQLRDTAKSSAAHL